ncbi:Crp/Fnr family transcriptional regulator [bacterium]|nr:Crp/Fnr family transcriptional regulator [bacterium]
MSRISAPRGTLLFSEGDEADGFFVVSSGIVKIFRVTESGQEAVMHIVRPGDTFGEPAIFLDMTYPAAAITLSRAEIWFVPKKPFLKELDADPQFARRLLAGFSAKVKEFNQRFESLTADKLETRLAKWLLLEFGREGHLVEEYEYELPIPKNALAAHLGASPETLSRSFRSLVDDGLLSVRGKTIVFHALEALRRRGE